MRFAICNELFEGWRLDDVFPFVADLGYSGVELAPFTLAENVTDLPAERRREIVASAAAHGLTITGFHWLLARTTGLNICHPDPEVRNRTATYLKKLIGTCADFGGTVMVFGSPQQRWLLPDVSYGEATRFALEIFADCARAAELARVVFCLEALPPPEANFMTTTAEVIGLVEQIDSPNLKLVLDVKSMCAEATPIPESIRQAAPYLAYFHANDANRRGPGFGAVDYVPIFQALGAVGYDGFVSVEVFDFTGGPEVIARESLAYLQHTAALAGVNAVTPRRDET